MDAEIKNILKINELFSFECLSFQTENAFLTHHIPYQYRVILNKHMVNQKGQVHHTCFCLLYIIYAVKQVKAAHVHSYWR